MLGFVTKHPPLYSADMGWSYVMTMRPTVAEMAWVWWFKELGTLRPRSYGTTQWIYIYVQIQL